MYWWKIIVQNKSILTDIQDVHNHKPETIANSNSREVRSRYKNKVCEDLNLRPNKIVRTNVNSKCITTTFHDT